MSGKKSVQIQPRKNFTRDEKLEILEKSNGRCAHCGEVLFNKQTKGIKEYFTIDHVIPLIRGGSNDLINLVALCKTCNKDKGESIVNERTYYTYLTNRYQREITESFKEYEREVLFLTKSSLFLRDEFVIEHTTKTPSKKKAIVFAKSKVCRANYCDLDEILAFLENYKKHFGLEVDMYRLVSAWFDLCAIYYIRHNNGNITAVFLPQLTTNNDSSTVSISTILPLVNIIGYIDPKVDIVVNPASYGGMSIVDRSPMNRYSATNLSLSGAKYYSALNSFADHIILGLKIPAGSCITVSVHKEDERFLGLFCPSERECYPYLTSGGWLVTNKELDQVFKNAGGSIGKELTVSEFLAHPGVRYALSEYKELLDEMYPENNQYVLEEVTVAQKYIEKGYGICEYIEIDDKT